MLHALERASEALKGAPPDHLVVVTAPWNGQDAWQLGRSERRGVWDARALVADEPVVARWGAAATIEARGPSRLSKVREAGQRLLSDLIRWDDAPHAPRPRLWGGISFSTSGARVRGEAPDDPWHGFGEARFVLPRWEVGVSRQGAYLQLAATAREIRASEALRREAQEVLRAPAVARETGPARSSTRVAERLSLPPPPEREAFVSLVERALRQIDHHVIDKVVVARAERHALASPLDVDACMRRLARSQPGCALLAFPGGDQILVGATPEKLVVRRGHRVQTEALAGTAPRGPHAMGQLLESDKDRREHALVVEGVTRALRRSGARVEHPAEPQCRALAQVVHLVTPIVATGVDRHVLEWVDDLHPTPAMGGWPRREAAAFIQSHEPVWRGWYASPVGWFDDEGDGTFVVAIRSAVVNHAEAWLFAGAGVVEGSDPQQELEETGHKLAAMRGALEVAP